VLTADSTGSCDDNGTFGALASADGSVEHAADSRQTGDTIPPEGST
jgi:hypothetical protein